MKVVAAGAGALFVLPILAIIGASGTPPTPPDDPVGGAVRNVPKEYVALVEQAGAMCSPIPPPVIAAQIDAESSWNPNANSQYAEGIAQFTPATWKQWGKDYNKDGKANVWDPADAIPSQGRYMCEMAKEVKAAQKTKQITHGTVLDNALAAYNAGLGPVLHSMGVPTGISETDSYYKKIEQLISKYSGSKVGASGPYGKASVAAAAGAIGKPYITGGGDKDGPTKGGFDCSGLVLYAVYQGTHGKLLLPHYTGTMHKDPRIPVIARGSKGMDMGRALAAAGAQPGDILQFNVPEDPKPWGHVALVSDTHGGMIEAPHPGSMVKQLPVYNYYQWELRRPLTKYTGASSKSPRAAAASYSWTRHGRSPRTGPAALSAVLFVRDPSSADSRSEGFVA